MKRKKKIGVVADDVTGANDIGIMFQRGGYRSAVFPLGLLELCDLKKGRGGTGCGYYRHGQSF